VKSIGDRIGDCIGESVAICQGSSADDPWHIATDSPIQSSIRFPLDTLPSNILLTCDRLYQDGTGIICP
jgi:hypothetical protein